MNLDEIISATKAEIELCTKRTAGTRINNLVKEGDIYRAFSDKKIADGEYLLSSSAAEDQVVTIEFNHGTLFVSGIDSEYQTIYSATIQKDETSLLKAVLDKLLSIKANKNIIKDPFFIVGPPGTGKTKVIVEIISEAYKANKRVLIVSQTNMAVENVFERIAFDHLAIKTGDAILSIKTENPALAEYSPTFIKEAKLRPLNDELDLLKSAIEEIIKQKRDAELLLSSSSEKDETISIMISNTITELSQQQAILKKAQVDLANQGSRLTMLDSNMLIKAVASSFMGVKVSEIKAEISVLETIISATQDKITSLETKKETLQQEKSKNDLSLMELSKQEEEIKEAKSKVDTRIKEIKLEIDDIDKLSLFGYAKIVGATLMSASLNQKINSAEFDIIIVDEASMGSLPVVALACQSVKIAEQKHDTEDKEFSGCYAAQNMAINGALKSQFIFVGDPKQTSPIAKTTALTKSIFDVYDIEKMFKGEAVENAVMLDINFRNHPDIVELASRLFYDGLLKSGRESNGKKSLFIRKTKGLCTRDDGSYVNHTNAVIVQETVKDALGRGRRSIGVVTPFRKQAENINTRLNSFRSTYSDADMQAGTIHKFQGKEKAVILFDVTISAGAQIPAMYNGDMNSATAKLLNVAMTRAEDFFILVGDIDGLENQLKTIQGHESLALFQWIVGIKELAYK